VILVLCALRPELALLKHRHELRARPFLMQYWGGVTSDCHIHSPLTLLGEVPMCAPKVARLPLGVDEAPFGIFDVGIMPACEVGSSTYAGEHSRRSTLNHSLALPQRTKQFLAERLFRRRLAHSEAKITTKAFAPNQRSNESDPSVDDHGRCGTVHPTMLNS
jgi:hypothetical protein